MLSLFNLLCQQPSRIKESPFASDISFKTSVACQIPKWEFCAGSKFGTPSIQSPATFSRAGTNSCTVSVNGEGQHLDFPSINLGSIINTLPDGCFWQLNGKWYSTNGELEDYPLINKVIVDKLAQKVYYSQVLFALRFTGDDPWCTWTFSNSSNYGPPSAHCTLNELAPFTLSGPYNTDLKCSHFKPYGAYDPNTGKWTYDNSSTTWEFWGKNALRIYRPAGISTLSDWLSFLRSENTAGRPLTIYTPIDLEDYSDFVYNKTDITSTPLGQYLLNLNPPFEQYAGNMRYEMSCSLSNANNAKIKLYYLDK
jgi:hypothetical protein